MRIAVLEFEQTPESNPTPIHYVSKSLSEKFLAHRQRGKAVAKRVSEFVIWICANITFRKLKRLLSDPRHESRPVYSLGVPFIPEELPLAELPGIKVTKIADSGRVRAVAGYARIFVDTGMCEVPNSFSN